MTDALLQHERYHLKIWEAAATTATYYFRKIEGTAISCTEASAKKQAESDYDKLSEAKRHSIFDKANKFQKQYDDETEHGTNPEKQALWQKNIDQL